MEFLLLPGYSLVSSTWFGSATEGVRGGLAGPSKNSSTILSHLAITWVLGSCPSGKINSYKNEIRNFLLPLLKYQL
jgi:hypothetical protein